MASHSSRTLVLSFLLLSGVCVAAENVTEPQEDSSKGIPNSSLKVAAEGLDDEYSYDIRLLLQLSGSGNFFEVGATNDFQGDEIGDHSELVDVTYNPGPGEHPGKVILNLSSMGQYQEVDKNEFTWIGPQM